MLKATRQGVVRSPLPPALSFDPEKRSASWRLSEAVRHIVTVLENREARLGARKRRRSAEDRRKFKLAVEAIVCNLVAARLSSPDALVAVPRDANVMWPSKRYGTPVYGSHFLAALDLMADPNVGLAEIVTKGFRVDSERRQLTTIVPTPAFLAMIGAEPSWGDLKQDSASEVLVLRGRKDRKTGIAPTLDYQDTATTRRLRKEVKKLNRYLEAAPLIVLSSSGPDATPIDPTRRTVRRIFNNGVWTEGGRFFDGYWETLPKAERFERLRIATAETPEGERIVNVDYGQLFPSLAYTMQDLPRPDADLYDVRRDGRHREGFKKLLNALLFATQPMTRWPTDTASEFPPGTKLQTVLAEIASYHEPIAHLFGSGIGFRLMNIESAILLDALFRLYAAGITALPLHDSVLVAASQEMAAREAMQSAYLTFGRSRRVKIATQIS
nr:hypothetical protein [Methylobacterium sp. ZNC0032]